MLDNRSRTTHRNIMVLVLPAYSGRASSGGKEEDLSRACVARGHGDADGALITMKANRTFSDGHVRTAGQWSLRRHFRERPAGDAIRGSIRGRGREISNGDGAYALSLDVPTIR